MTGMINISSFREGDQISMQYTCDGRDISPAISWSDFPPETKSYAIIMDDPDAPMRTFVHWVVYNIPSKITEMRENFPKVQVSEHGIMQGKNDFGKFCYGGPCPPQVKSHTDIFSIYILRCQIQRYLQEWIRRSFSLPLGAGYLKRKLSLLVIRGPDEPIVIS